MPREFWIDANTRITDRNNADDLGTSNGTTLKIMTTDAADATGRSFTADLIEVSGAGTVTTNMIGRYPNPGPNDKTIVLKLVDKKLDTQVRVVFRIHPTRPERDRIILKRSVFKATRDIVERLLPIMDDPDVESFVRHGTQETQPVVPGPPRKFPFSTALQPGTVSIRNNGGRVAYDVNGVVRLLSDSSQIGLVNYGTGVVTMDAAFADPITHAEAFLI